jgi:hypothetical protein
LLSECILRNTAVLGFWLSETFELLGAFNAAGHRCHLIHAEKQCDVQYETIYWQLDLGLEGASLLHN